jgi:hypothetical protein
LIDDQQPTIEADPILTSPAPTTIMVGAADNKVNFIAWYKEVFGFTDAVAKAL